MAEIQKRKLKRWVLFVIRFRQFFKRQRIFRPIRFAYTFLMYWRFGTRCSKKSAILLTRIFEG